MLQYIAKNGGSRCFTNKTKARHAACCRINRFQQHVHGFTLIELLVVIAIVALLMSIMVPSLQKAKLAAEEIICRSNLKQYGMGGQMYLQDYNSVFPNAWDSIYKTIDDGSQWCQWHDEIKHPDRRVDLQGGLWHYLGGGNKVHYCRTFARFARSVGADHSPNHREQIPIEPLFCYSMNAFLGGFINNHTMIVKSSQIRNPADIFFFAEENGWAYTSSEADPYYPELRYTATLNDNALCGGRRHPSNAAAWTDDRNIMPPFQDAFGSFHETTIEKRNEGMANVVLIDGHVESVEPDRTFYYTKPLERQPVLRK